MDTVDTKQLTGQVTVSNGTARYEGHGRSQSLDVIALPDAFVRWQLDYKHSVYDAIERDDDIALNAEVITPEDKRYRFAWAMRRLFEYEPFHVVQTMYPYSYIFWVDAWKNKTPKRRYPGKRSDNTVDEGGGRVDPSALRAMGNGHENGRR